jgi:hypothetical protein
LADLEKELKLCIQAANRWTDNIFNCRAYLVKKKSMDRKQVDKLLGIGDDFDCTLGLLFLHVYAVPRCF